MTFNNEIGEFVRGFFRYLEARSFRSAALHGWEQNFDDELSDVDFVIESSGLADIAAIVNRYCHEVGWNLNQVLRHENTAAFCVCSPPDDPTCVVALDACSDYQRNGRVFMTAEELLENRQPLDWGGFRLDAPIELRYRFIKSAAKAKEPAEMAKDLLAMTLEARRGFEDWLAQEWNISNHSWDIPGMIRSLQALEQHCGPALRQRRLKNLRRLFRRIVRPDGLLVHGATKNPEVYQHLSESFRRLYFRHTKIKKDANFRDVEALIRSTLIMIDQGGAKLRWILPRDTVLRLDPEISPAAAARLVSEFLQQRCLQREGVSK